jgi:hypothetical protein
MQTQPSINYSRETQTFSFHPGKGKGKSQGKVEKGKGEKGQGKGDEHYGNVVDMTIINLLHSTVDPRLDRDHKLLLQILYSVQEQRITKEQLDIVVKSIMQRRYYIDSILYTLAPDFEGILRTTFQAGSLAAANFPPEVIHQRLFHRQTECRAGLGWAAYYIHSSRAADVNAIAGTSVPCATAAASRRPRR